MKLLVKEAWVARLRSGKYKQGKDMLKSNKGYCCLGVLCDLYVDTHSKVKWTETAPNEDNQAFNILGETDFLPPEVMNWAGLKDQDPLVEVNKKSSTLSNLNDGGRKIKGKRATFKDIANIIEARL